MKIIDKTPFLDEKGELGIKQRLQGMLQFGFNWPNELQAQKAIINFFDRQLERDRSARGVTHHMHPHPQHAAGSERDHDPNDPAWSGGYFRHKRHPSARQI